MNEHFQQLLHTVSVQTPPWRMDDCLGGEAYRQVKVRLPAPDLDPQFRNNDCFEVYIALEMAAIVGRCMIRSKAYRAMVSVSCNGFYLGSACCGPSFAVFVVPIAPLCELFGTGIFPSSLII